MTGWRGKTIYRECGCRDTAHDARYVIASQSYRYQCRNCSKVFDRFRRADPAPDAAG